MRMTRKMAARGCVTLANVSIQDATIRRPAMTETAHGSAVFHLFLVSNPGC